MVNYYPTARVAQFILAQMLAEADEALNTRLQADRQTADPPFYDNSPQPLGHSWHPPQPQTLVQAPFTPDPRPARAQSLQSGPQQPATRVVRTVFGPWSYDMASLRQFNFSIWTYIQLGYLSRAFSNTAPIMPKPFEQAGTSHPFQEPFAHLQHWTGYGGPPAPPLLEDTPTANGRQAHHQCAVRIGGQLWDDFETRLKLDPFLELLRRQAKHLKTRPFPWRQNRPCSREIFKVYMQRHKKGGRHQRRPFHSFPR